MSKRKSDGTVGLVIVFILVLAFLAGGVVFGTHTYFKVSRQSKADEATLKAWTEVWGNGESVTGIVVKTKDKAVRDCYELRYTVDGTDYAVVCTLKAKTFEAIDGEDGDGQGAVEIHYDPNDPQVATSEAALEGQKEIGKNNSASMMIMTAAILFVLFGIVTEVLKKVRRG